MVKTYWEGDYFVMEDEDGKQLRFKNPALNSYRDITLPGLQNIDIIVDPIVPETEMWMIDKRMLIPFQGPLKFVCLRCGNVIHQFQDDKSAKCDKCGITWTNSEMKDICESHIYNHNYALEKIKLCENKIADLLLEEVIPAFWELVE